MDFSIRIAKELNLTVDAVRNTIELLDEGASIPFIARYRKEATGSLNEVVITAIRDRCRQLGELEARREYILQSVREQGKLTADLEKRINEAETLYQLEDLYLPYKPKRKTRASVARERWLEPQKPVCRATSARMCRSCSAAVQPVFSSRSSGSRTFRWVRVPTRTMKNSSMLDR